MQKGNAGWWTRRVSEWRPTGTRGPSRKSGPTYDVTAGQAHDVSVNQHYTCINRAAIYSTLFHNSKTVYNDYKGIQEPKHLQLESNVNFQQNSYTAVVN